MESRSRSICKALTWRATALAITTLVVWIVTSKARVAVSVGLVDTAIKLLAYYAHERCWLKVSFGRPRPPEYEI